MQTLTEDFRRLAVTAGIVIILLAAGLFWERSTQTIQSLISLPEPENMEQIPPLEAEIPAE